jgi:hypothetical protein
MMSIFWPAIVASIAANMVIGFLWYGPLFGKAWAKEIGQDMSNKPSAKQMYKSMGLMLIGTFLLAYCLAFNVEAWRVVMGVTIASGQAPGMQASQIPMVLAINSAAWTTVGYFVPMLLNQVAFENRSWKLFFINAGYYLTSLAVMSTLLAFWVKIA